MNQQEFLNVTSWSKHHFWLFCNKVSKKYGAVEALKALMTLRKELQKAVSVYSRGKSETDARQVRAIWMTEMLMRWCGDTYRKVAMQEMLKTRPELVHKPQKLKGLINNEWECYVRNEYTY